MSIPSMQQRLTFNKELAARHAFGENMN